MKLKMRRISTKHWILTVLIIVIFFYIILYNAFSQPEIAIVKGWDYKTSRNITNYVLPNTSTFYLKPEGFCKIPIFLLVIVASAPSNFAARSAIRESWALNKNVSGKAVRTYFLLGETRNSSIQFEIEEENRSYDDIVQENFFDSYNNLTIKSVMLLKLVQKYCMENVDFVMKCDDDTFVNMVPLIKSLASKPKHNVLTGTLICEAKPIENSNDKWYAPKYMFSEKMYPNYLSGSGYVMSVDVASALYSSALNTSLFYLEDIYITGICAKKAGIRPFHHPGFSYLKQKIDDCAVEHMITSHKNSPEEMIFIHKTLPTKNSSLCIQKKKSKKKSKCL